MEPDGVKCPWMVNRTDGRRQPWTSYDKVLKWSMHFIKQCPTVPTKFGDDPWYLVTSKFSVMGELPRLGMPRRSSQIGSGRSFKHASQ